MSNMTDCNHTDGDVYGRIMSLEQKVRGLSARIHAMELSLSLPGGRESSTLLAEDEFVPATSAGMGEDVVLENRLLALEKALTLKEPKDLNLLAARHTKDMTGILIGGILIVTGILLYTGSTDILRNPLLSLGCGILIIACAIARVFL